MKNEKKNENEQTRESSKVDCKNKISISKLVVLFLLFPRSAFFFPMFKPQKALSVKESRALSGKDVKTLRKKVEAQFNLEGENVFLDQTFFNRPPLFSRPRPHFLFLISLSLPPLSQNPSSTPSCPQRPRSRSSSSPTAPPPGQSPASPSSSTSTAAGAARCSRRSTSSGPPSAPLLPLLLLLLLPTLLLLLLCCSRRSSPSPRSAARSSAAPTSSSKGFCPRKTAPLRGSMRETWLSSASKATLSPSPWGPWRSLPPRLWRGA